MSRTSLVPVDRLVDACVVTWDDDPPVAIRSPNAHDPVVVLRLLADRGVILDGLSPAKAKLRLKLCVRQGYLSLVQSVAVREHLFGD